MHHQHFLMFKSNPFAEEFQKYNGKTIRTIPIQTFSFFYPQQTQEHSHCNKIYLKKPKNIKQSNSPIKSPLKTICPDKKDSKKIVQNFLIKTPKKKQKKATNVIQKDSKALICGKSMNQEQILPYPQKQTETQKFNQIKKLSLTLREEKSDLLGESRFCRFNGQNIKNEKVRDQNNLKQKLYQSIDFDNLFSKIQSQVTHFDRSQSPEDSPKIKDKLIMLDRMKRYSKTPNSKARSVFDQFNLKYLINKRKNFNMKNESNIKGSHLPYFQSFNSSEMRSLSKAQKRNEINTSLDKMSRKSPELSPIHGESRKKMSSFIVIDDHGIVHEQNPECKNRDQMIKKLSGKLINMRQMLMIQKIEPGFPL